MKKNFPLDTFEEYDAIEGKLANEEDKNIYVTYLLNNSKSLKFCPMRVLFKFFAIGFFLNPIETKIFLCKSLKQNFHLFYSIRICYI